MTGLGKSNLVVTPKYLETLAARQETAADLAKKSKGKTEDVETQVWTTYGVFSNQENQAFVRVENARHAAVDRVERYCRKLAAMLRASGEQYASTDAALAQDLDQQLTCGEQHPPASGFNDSR